MRGEKNNPRSQASRRESNPVIPTLVIVDVSIGMKVRRVGFYASRKHDEALG